VLLDEKTYLPEPAVRPLRSNRRLGWAGLGWAGLACPRSEPGEPVGHRPAAPEGWTGELGV